MANNLSERCSYCIHAIGEHDMFYLDCNAPEDYRVRKSECPYYETSHYDKNNNNRIETLKKN